MTDASRGIVRAWFDGLCGAPRPGAPSNPGGVACGGWHFTCDEALEVGPHSGYAFYVAGHGATNNVAEYRAAIDALKAVAAAGWSGAVELRGDSQLVIRQANGEWACKVQHLRTLCSELRAMMARFESCALVWVPRTQNETADRLSRSAYTEWLRAHNVNPALMPDALHTADPGTVGAGALSHAEPVPIP
jgi:ribonuclease HI